MPKINGVEIHTSVGIIFVDRCLKEFTSGPNGNADYSTKMSAVFKGGRVQLNIWYDFRGSDGKKLSSDNNQQNNGIYSPAYRLLLLRWLYQSISPQPSNFTAYILNEIVLSR
jgi:hypothetical protein